MPCQTLDHIPHGSECSSGRVKHLRCVEERLIVGRASRHQHSAVLQSHRPVTIVARLSHRADGGEGAGLGIEQLRAGQHRASTPHAVISASDQHSPVAEQRCLRPITRCDQIADRLERVGRCRPGRYPSDQDTEDRRRTDRDEGISFRTHVAFSLSLSQCAEVLVGQLSWMLPLAWYGQPGRNGSPTRTADRVVGAGNGHIRDN